MVKRWCFMKLESGMFVSLVFLLWILGCSAENVTRPLVQFYVASRLNESLIYNPITSYLEQTPGFTSGETVSARRPTVVLLHGLAGSVNASSNFLIARELIDHGGHNILVADYATSTSGPDYEVAARSVVPVGLTIGKYLLEAHQNGSISLTSTSLVGFSLGAQVAGVAGNFLREQSSPVYRIVGLDPALPGFNDVPDETRLDRTDAEFVMAIHTAGGFLSFLDPVGHADFYPNGGKEVQPLCEGSKLSTLVCSHLAACRYFAESITLPGFKAVKCDSWNAFLEGNCTGNPTASMGFYTEDGVEGSFYLKTNPHPPFGAAENETVAHEEPLDTDRMTTENINAINEVSNFLTDSTPAIHLSYQNVIFLLSSLTLSLFV